MLNAGGKKGKLLVLVADTACEHDLEFVRLRHSAVESAINALEVHGHDGFKHYVVLGVVAPNIQRLGAVLRQQAREQVKR